MEMTERYTMRASSERKHQAQTKAESVTFGILDHFRTDDLFKHLNETEFKECANRIHLVSEMAVKATDHPIEYYSYKVMIMVIPAFITNEQWKILKTSERAKIVFMMELANQMRRSADNFKQ